jgi:CRP-like cAMP-binding protein
MGADRLERHELFALLNPMEMARLSEAAAVVTVKRGERLYSEGLPAGHFFVLLKGKVELRRPTKDGPGVVVEELAEGDIFGVSSLVGAERYLLNAECVEDAGVLKIERGALRRLLDENPVVGYAIQKKISAVFFSRYVDAMERLESITRALLGPRAVLAGRPSLHS